LALYADVGTCFQLQAQQSLDNFLVNNQVIENKNNTVMRCNEVPNLSPISPFPLTLETKGQLCSSEEAKKTTCSFQAYGYGLGSVSASPNQL
jgi:hypothetical protein